MREQDRQELLKILDLMEAFKFDQIGSSIERLHQQYPQDIAILNIYGEYLYATKQFIRYLEIFSKMISPESKEIDYLYKMGTAYLEVENFVEAKKYIDKALQVNHRYSRLFDYASMLNTIMSILNAYPRQNNDPWFLLSAANVFRKFNFKNHRNKFLSELKEKFPFMLDLTFVKCELEFLELVDNHADENQVQELFKKWAQVNPYIPCLFHYHNYYADRNVFSKVITR